MSVERVDSLDDPRLAVFSNLKDNQAASRHGVFIAESELVVRQVLEAGWRVRSVLVTPTKAAAMAPVLGDAAVLVATQEVMERVAGFHVHRGVLAAVERGAVREWREAARHAPAAIVTEGMSNHDNVGGVFRLASCLLPTGACVLQSPTCCDPLYRKAVRVSMGHVLRVPFATMDPFVEGLRELAAMGFTTVALTPGAGAEDVREVARRLGPASGTRIALVLGAEGPGLTEGAIGTCAIRARIPMRAGVDSLNVVTAAAVAAWEVCGRMTAE